jgi:hypothetical protein
MTDLQRFFVSVFSLTAMSSASAKALPTYVRVRSAASQQFQGPPRYRKLRLPRHLCVLLQLEA